MPDSVEPPSDYDEVFVVLSPHPVVVCSCAKAIPKSCANPRTMIIPNAAEIDRIAIAGMLLENMRCFENRMV